MATLTNLKERAAKTQNRERVEQNILDSVKLLLSEGKHEEARTFFFDNSSGVSRDAIKEVFMAYPPKIEICKVCAAEMVFVLRTPRYEWVKIFCPNCERLSVKSEILKNIANIMQSQGVPKRFANAEINDFPIKYRNILPGGSGLFLHGPRGTGKTHLMAALMRDEILKVEPLEAVGSYTENTKDILYFKPYPSYYPLFLTVPELLLEIRSTFNRQDGDGEQELLEKYSSVGCLFLDDLGTEKVTEWVGQVLFLLIDRRYGAMLQTVISSNLSLDKIASRLDDRITSRIAEMCKVYKIEGKDRRIK